MEGTNERMKKKHSVIQIDIANRQYVFVLAASYIAVCMIVVASIFIMMSSWFRGYIKEKVYEMSSVQLENITENVNHQLDYYQVSLQNLFMEPHIKASLYTNQSDAINEWNITRYLQYAVNNDGYIDYSVIYQKGRLKQIIGHVYPSEEEQQEVLEKLQSTQHDKQVFFINNEETSQRRFFLFRMERDSLNGPPQRGVLYAINQSKISDMLLASEDDKYSYLVFDKEGNLILSQNEEEQAQIEKINESANAAQGQLRELEIGASTYFLTSSYSSDYQLNFVQLMDVSEMDKVMGAYFKRSQIWVALVLIISCILATIVARMIYKPLKRFFKRISSYSRLEDEPSMYGDSITQMTSEKIISQISEISRQVHTDQVLGFLEDEPGEASIPSALKLREQERVLLLYGRSKIGRVDGKQARSLFEAMGKALSGYQTKMFSEENGWYCVYLICEKALIKTEQSAVISLISDVLEQQQRMGSNLYLLCSDWIIDEHDFQSEFRKLQEFSKYVLFGECDQVCNSSIFETKKDEDVPKKLLQPVIDAAKCGDEIQAKQLMATLLKQLSGYEIKKIFHALSYFSTELENVSVQVPVATKKYQEIYMMHYIKLSSLINQKQLYDYLSNLIEDACLEVNTYQERSIRTDMLSALEYINSHYQEPELSVEQVSEVIHISPSYFSRMFREISELSFPEYVNNLRLNYASELLKTKRLSVKEVAQKAGFSGTSYFSAQFKKKYGISPSSYRNETSKSE